LASSLQGADASTLLPTLGETPTDLLVGGAEYVGLSRPLAGSDGPRFVVLRSRTERLRFLEPLRTALLAAAAAAVLGAVLLSYLVSRTVTRPLAEITSAMREIARTGDFSRKLPPERTSYDEDARVLGSAFDTLLDSVVHFQREAAAKERLSALGRLSTVIAHEVRNPLMIIKASLRGLHKPAATPEDVKEAALDIDHEVARLNRIVGDVLDFARPPRLDIQPTDLHALCRDAAAAGLAGEAGQLLKLELGFAGETLLTDAERLRTALVNVLGNAREAVAAKRSAAEAAPGAAVETRNGFDIELSTGPAKNGGAWVRVRDHGVGIAAVDLPHVFEPYFTTKRTGTGLGLAIARNIVLSLGGHIEVTSAAEEGTEVAIELPSAAPGAPAGEGP
jgi:two-component system sensor histidine kinase AtoS